MGSYSREHIFAQSLFSAPSSSANLNTAWILTQLRYIYITTQGFESKMDVIELKCYVKAIIVFYINFMTSFLGGIIWWTDRVITHATRQLSKLKHPDSRVNAFWYYFSIIKRNTFHYLMKSAPIPGNQSSFEILQLFDIWHDQVLVILFFSSIVILT